MAKEHFPKISAAVKIKKVVMCDKAQLAFEDLEFSPGQYAQLERWRQYKDPILLTLEQTQANINDEKKEDVQDKLFDDQAGQEQIKFDQTEYTINEDNVVENPSVLEVGLPKYKTIVIIEWAVIEGKYYIGYEIETFKDGISVPVHINNLNNPPFDSLSDALITAQDKICAYVKDNKFKNYKQIQTKVIKTVENYLEGIKADG